MTMTHLIDKLYMARDQYEEDGDKEGVRVINNAIKELHDYKPSRYIIEEKQN